MRIAIGLLLALNVAAVSEASDFSNARAARACDRIVQWINDGSIARRFIELNQPSRSDDAMWRSSANSSPMQYIKGIATVRIRGRDRTFATIASGGTCEWPAMIELPGVGRTGDIWTRDEGVRWASWGHDENLLVLDNEPFIVTGTFDEIRAKGSLVSWIGADGLVQPICGLETTGTEVVKRVSNKVPGLCRAAQSGGVEFVDWERFDYERDWRKPLGALGMRFDSIRRVRIDHDGDQVASDILLIDYSSDSGCGSDHQYLVAASGVGQIDSSSLVNSLLLARQWGPIPNRDVNDHAADARWFTHRDRTYLLSRGKATSMSVISFEHGAIRSLCEFQIRPVHRVSHRFALSDLH